jgi:hypothetical protein
MAVSPETGIFTVFVYFDDFKQNAVLLKNGHFDQKWAFL